MIRLKDHQKKPIEFMRYNRGLILYHSTGSGKTYTALYAMYQFSNDIIIIIGPKSSKKTFADSIQKAEMDEKRFLFYTYNKIKKILSSSITFFKDRLVIIDEAHNLRNENMHNLYLTSALSLSSKIMLLTATPVVNYLNDLSILVNVVQGQDVLPTERELFDQMFYDDEKMIITNENILISKIMNTISYYSNEDDENYPNQTVSYINVEMSHEQLNEYIFYVKKIIYEDKDFVSEVDVLNIDYGLLPSKKRNFFLNVTRQLSNTINNSDSSPKINEIFNKIMTGPHPIIIYSNFLKNGIYPLAIRLDKHNIKYKTITGNTSSDKLNLIVNNYNNGMYTVLLLSSAGSESLDLKNTRQIHIMEPYWNYAKIRQVIGRAIRYKSHDTLPKEERKVDIYHWISVFPPRIKNKSADQYLIELSQKKQDLWDKYQKIIIDASIENNFFAKKNNSGFLINQMSRNYHYKYRKYRYKYLELLKQN